MRDQASGQTQPRHPARGRSRALAAALTLAALALALATAASAHHGEPATGEDEVGTLGADNTGGQVSTDTYLTPVPKGDGAEKAGWQQVAGSRWQLDGDITRMASPVPGVPSPTPYDLDFYGVRFLDVPISMNAGLSREDAVARAKVNGFAVGAQCKRDPANPSQPVPPDEVAGCERIPVIYRYRDDRDRGLVWEESLPRDDANDRGGFVAAVTWLGPDRALAVGGAGTYPRREPGCVIDTPGCPDPAGMARAWLFEEGSWRELENEPDPEGGFTGEAGDEIPDQMRALQAIDASPRPKDCGPSFEHECAVAGGFRQLWHFADGSFTRGYGPGLANGGPLTSAANFRFRVREIDFTPDWAGSSDMGDTPPDTYARAVTSGCCSPDRTSDLPAFLHFGPPITSVRSCAVGSATCWQAQVKSIVSTNLNDVLDTPRTIVGVTPDSYYSLEAGWGLNSYGSALMTPGGPPEHYGPREPSPRFTGQSLVSNMPQQHDIRLSSLRLVSADRGWAVGFLRSSGQGIAYDAGGQAGGLATSATCPNDDALVPGTNTSNDPNKGPCSLEGYQRQNASKGIYAIGSYALNAYRVAGEDVFRDNPQVAWAVGDHGAIATRDGGVAGAEAPPARSGAKSKPVPLPRGEAFDRHRAAVTDEPGTVPALAPGTLPAETGFYEGQSPGGSGASQIVMSRDGQEGWAFGGSTYHFDGRRWALCYSGSPDPACAGAPNGVSRALRVPLERDSDPTNDELFEVWTTGGYRYRNGRWSNDPAAVPNPLPDVLISPDEGWSGTSRFNGTGYVQCNSFSTPTAECADPDKRLWIQGPMCATQPDPRVVAAGDRIYLLAIRREPHLPHPGFGISWCNPSLNQTRPPEKPPYPVILYRDTDEPCEKSGDPGCWRGGRDTTNDATYNPTDGGWDPGCISRTGTTCDSTKRPEDQGQPPGLFSVAQNADDSFGGWASAFGAEAESAEATMMRLSDGTDVPEAREVGDTGWRPWSVRDAAADYDVSGYASPLILPSEAGRRNAFLFSGRTIETAEHYRYYGPGLPALAFDQERGRWVATPTPWSATAPDVSAAGRALTSSRALGGVSAVGADGQGGFWTNNFHHYTDRTPKPVFAETPDPTAGKAEITALGAGADGSVWLGDENGGVYRYDRLVGWSARVPIPEWDPVRATRRAPVSAIAVGPDGEGVAIGPGGRIANLGEQVRLDPAATIGCDPQAIVPPCGRGSDLLAAAVAPDGSATAAGKSRTLLWRPSGGDFRPIEGPPVPAATQIVDVEMPRPDRAYLLTGVGRDGKDPASRVIAGEMTAPGVWDWTIEIGSSEGTSDPLAAERVILDLAVDAVGHGYAVGRHPQTASAGGLLLEREGGGTGTWRRIESGYPDAALSAVALPAAGGPGALIGGPGGLLLTLVRERFEVARHAEPYDPVTGSITKLALTPGYATDEVEAWALRRGSVHLRGTLLWQTQDLLHYPSDPADPRLSPSRGLSGLPDAPPSNAGEVSFAAFGKQDCDATKREGAVGVSVRVSPSGPRYFCGPPDGSNGSTADLINRRIREELAARSASEGEPQFALFTGDAVDMPGGWSTTAPTVVYPSAARTPLDPNLKLRRWVEIAAEPLAEQGLATFGAIGGQDLARNLEFSHDIATERTVGGSVSPGGVSAEQLGVQPGLNLPWRAAMTSLPAPWEREQEASGLRFERVGAGVLSQRGPDAQTPTVTSVGAAAPPLHPNVDPLLELLRDPSRSPRTESYALDSGDTHYAVDMVDEATEEKVARIVVVDTSMRSLAASDPLQHPIEAGGQLRWLDEMTCLEGSAEDTDGDVRDCTREEGQQAIVLSNTPTYSYGPISPEETQTDAAAFEAILLKNQVNVVVSGRLGWNGRYWAVAPGVHAPCPGQGYRSDSEAPSISRPEICGASAVGGTQGVVPDAGQLIQELPEDAKQAAGLAGRSAIPFVVSSSAGGRFNEKAVRGGFATAENGFWRGYSIVRLSPDGDPAKTIVEQRPILDWVGLSAHDPSVAPGERLQLQSFAREAFGMDTAPRYYEIPETQVITHRYHLLLADPGEPWRACEASDSTCQAYYSKLAEGPRSFDSASGGAARSAQDDSAVASAAASSESASENPCEPYLCLPERIGTIDPDTGEVRAGNGKHPGTYAIAMLSIGDHVATQPLYFKKSPSFIVFGAVAFPELPSQPASATDAPAPPPPPNPSQPNVPQPKTPEVPLPPPVPPIAASEPPEPQPPAPPAPPPPAEQPSPLDLTISPTALTVATPAAVIQPPTPPVNPAPPSGARREARQRQAATQKSGAASDEEQVHGDARDYAGDQVQGRASPDQAFRRRDRTRPEPSFTPLARADQPSAWAQGALYTGGIALMAFALAAGISRGRPTPKRRQDITPAPGLARAWRQGRG